MRALARLTAFLLALTLVRFALAEPRAPLPDTAYDGGIPGSETLGRGGTMASNRFSPASGSENPAALSQSKTNVTYFSALVGLSTDLPKSTATRSDALDNKTLRYMSAATEGGAIFFEPLGRIGSVVPLANGGTSETDFTANALGFSGGAKMAKALELGLSVSYLQATLGTIDRTPGAPDVSNFDTAYGLRLNMGARYEWGPTMWGLTLQNAPGFLWWKDYRRDQLPVLVRVGNTYRAAKGVLFSVDAEQRYYNEGSRKESFLYLGNETFMGPYFVLRAGVFGTNVSRTEERHVTAGATIKTSAGLEITYGLDTFEEDNQKVKRSMISMSSPFADVR